MIKKGNVIICVLMLFVFKAPAQKSEKKLYKLILLNGDTIYSDKAAFSSNPYFLPLKAGSDTIWKRVIAPHEIAFNSKNYTNAIKLIKGEINKYPWYLYNYQQMAFCYSKTQQYDSACFFLLQGLSLNKSDVAAVLSDPNLQQLFTTPAFLKIEKKLVEFEQLTHPDKPGYLNYTLYKVLQSDQYIRQLHFNYSQEYGAKSVKIDSILKCMALIDSLNLITVKQLIKTYGYPTDLMLTEYSRNTIFLVLLHSPLSVQKQYLPDIKKLAKSNKIKKAHYAYMWDRIKVMEGKKQKFGTQVKYNDLKNCDELCPIVSMKKVNMYRKKYGMESLEQYLAHYQMCK
jgi:tetratricopeptide (TPR) repeat protein